MPYTAPLLGDSSGSQMALASSWGWLSSATVYPEIRWCGGRRPFAFADAADLWEYRHSWDEITVKCVELFAPLFMSAVESSCGYLRKTSRVLVVVAGAKCWHAQQTTAGQYSQHGHSVASPRPVVVLQAAWSARARSATVPSQTSWGLGGGSACLEPVVSVNLQYCRVSVWGCHKHRPGLAVWIQRLPAARSS